jgi:hypothetical protein
VNSCGRRNLPGAIHAAHAPAARAANWFFTNPARPRPPKLAGSGAAATERLATWWQRRAEDPVYVILQFARRSEAGGAGYTSRLAQSPRSARAWRPDESHARPDGRVEDQSGSHETSERSAHDARAA